MIETLRAVSPLRGARVCPSRMVGHPQQALAVDDEHLVLLDETAPPALRVLNLARARVLRQTGSRGRSPGAFLGPRSLTRRKDDPDGVWAFDSVLHRLTRFDLHGEAVGLPPRRLPEHTVTLEAIHPVQQAEWAGDSIVATGAFPTNRLARFDAQGRLIETFGQVPGPHAEDLAIRQAAYESVLRVHPGGSLYALATRRADRLEVLDTDGHVLARAPRLQDFEPHYRVDRTFGRPVALFDERTRTGYIDLVAGADSLFALYGGRRPLECGAAASAGRLVVEFGWDLHLRRAFELDYDAIALGLSPCGTHLYAAIRSPGPGILRYALREDRPETAVLPFPTQRVV
ncbi:MAG: hypothetical protein R3E10_00880 [Gemmatimonadota bacterium]